MMCATKNLTRSLLSGLLLMGVSMAGVSQAGATSTARGFVDATLTIGVSSCSVCSAPGVFVDHSFDIGFDHGSGQVLELTGGSSSSGTGHVDSVAEALVASGPGVGSAFGLGVGAGTTSAYNPTYETVYLPWELTYVYGFGGEATTPYDFAAAGWGIFVVISDYGTGFDWSSDTIIPVAGDLDFTPPDFEDEGGDTIYGGLELYAHEAVGVTLVVLAGAKANTVPEPASLVLLGFGLVGLGAWRMKKKQTV